MFFPQCVFSLCNCCVGCCGNHSRCSLCTGYFWQKQLLSFRAEVFFLHRCEVACREEWWWGVTVAIPFCPVLNPVVPVQRTCLFRGKMCVVVLSVGRRQATRHWRDWQTVILWVDTGACVCISVCVSVLCSTDLFFEFTCVAMSAGLGPPSRCDVDLVCLIPALPPLRRTGIHARTHIRADTDTESAVRHTVQHTLLLRMLAHRNMHIIVFFRHMNALSFLHIEKWEQPYALIQSNMITTRRHRQLSFCVEWKISVMIIWFSHFLLFCLLTCPKIILHFSFLIQIELMCEKGSDFVKYYYQY